MNDYVRVEWFWMSEILEHHNRMNRQINERLQFISEKADMIEFDTKVVGTDQGVVLVVTFAYSADAEITDFPTLQ